MSKAYLEHKCSCAYVNFWNSRQLKNFQTQFSIASGYSNNGGRVLSSAPAS